MGKVKTEGQKSKKQGAGHAGGSSLVCAKESGTVKFFSPEDAAAAFTFEVFNEARCRAWLLEKLHPDGARCPDCGLALEGGAHESFCAGRRCACGRCGRRFTARTGTVLEGTQLDDRQLYGLAVFTQLEIFSPARIAEILKVTPNTVRFWSTKFRILRNMNEGG